MASRLSKNIAIIGAPTGLGQNHHDGVQYGPAYLRSELDGESLAAQLTRLGLTVRDMGDAVVPTADDRSATTKIHGINNYPALCIMAESLSTLTQSAIDDGFMPLVLGGDHSLALGSIFGAATAFNGRSEKIGIVWVDAHADINTPSTSPTGNAHGMPLAFLAGLNDDEIPALNVASWESGSSTIAGTNIAIMGARDIDEGEHKNISETGVTVFHCDPACAEHNIRQSTQRAIAIACQGTAGFYLSFDVDAIDPEAVPGTGTQVAHGITMQALDIALDEIYKASDKLLGIDIVEVNPKLDKNLQTLRVVRHIVERLFG